MTNGEKGKIYKFDGENFIEVEINENIKKIPITENALEQVKAVRNLVSKRIGKRPELDVTASAMLELASNLQDIEVKVEEYAKRYYQELYKF